MTTSRDAAIEALVGLVASAYPWKSSPSRKLKLWSDVPPAARPACFVFEGGLESYAWSEGAVPKRVIEPKLFIYFSAKGDTAGAALLNSVMDALDQALALAGCDLGLGRNTLAGAAYSCRIDGKILKAPGVLDGDALLVVPVRIVLP